MYNVNTRDAVHEIWRKDCHAYWHLAYWTKNWIGSLRFHLSMLIRQYFNQGVNTNSFRVLTLTLPIPILGGCGNVAEDSFPLEAETAGGVSEAIPNERSQFAEAQQVCAYLNGQINEYATHDEYKVKFWVDSDGALETKWVVKDITYRIDATDVSLESIRVGRMGYADGCGRIGSLEFEPKDNKVFKRSDTAFHNPGDDSKAHYISLSTVDAAERAKRA